MEKVVAIDLVSNLREVEARIAQACEVAGRSPSEVVLVGVTKGVAPSSIRLAFQAGLRNFGENRVQEAQEKMAQLQGLLPRPLWHMVGHLQSNKAKLAVSLFDMVQSVDSVRLAEKLSHHARTVLPLLLQVNLVGDAYGFPPEDVPSALDTICRMEHIEVLGLMAMAPAVPDKEETRPYFRRLRMLRDSLGLRHLSTGMTDDFEVAIQEGATMVRIGRAIFGERRTTMASSGA